MTPLECAILCQQFSEYPQPTIGDADDAFSMRVYSTPDGDVHCFQGTKNIESFLQDINIDTVKVGGLGCVHEGFWNTLHPFLPQALALPHPVAVTGHSLGAALAIMYGLILAEHGHKSEIYAIEPPRLAGDDTMALKIRMLNIPWYACRNGNDIITQIPPELSLPGVLTQIGEPFAAIDNLEDHKIDRVVVALRKQQDAFNDAGLPTANSRGTIQG